MFNNSLPVSSLFYKISLLCPPHCRPACIPCTFCSSIFCALCTIPLQCNFCLLCISATTLHLHHSHQQQQQPQQIQQQQQPISSLDRVLIVVVHLVHEMCAMPLHPHTASISSTSRVLCLIIATLQLLWWFPPCVQHHWVFC
jgi:hypothetical protein